MTHDRQQYFQRARAEVSLWQFIEASLGKPVMVDAQWRRWSSCVHCGESSADSLKFACDQHHYRCFSCGKRGSVVDAAAALMGVDPLEAAKKLLGAEFERYAVPAAAYSVDTDKAKAALRKQLASEVVADLRNVICDMKLANPDVMRYLTVERAIPEAVIKEAVNRKILGFLPSDAGACTRMLTDTIGQDRLERSGFWKAGSKMPAVAFRPLVFFLHKGSAEFRVIQQPRLGQSKSIRYGLMSSPFLWGSRTGTLEVVEGAIDMLSLVALGSANCIVGLPGCNNWKASWFAGLHDSGLAVDAIVRLDNDVGRDNGQNPGQEWAGEVIKVLTELGVTAVNGSPAAGDVNDVLKSKVKAKSAA